MTKKAAKPCIKQKQEAQTARPFPPAPPKHFQVLIDLEWLLLFSPFLLGVFFPWGSALVSLVLSFLCFLLLRRRQLCFTKSPVFLTAVSIVVFHVGGLFWGTDRGMALLGALQFLPLPLFVLLLEQYTPEQRTGLLQKTPYAASAMVLLSFLLSRIPVLESWILVAGRQAGFFQYPNTYAVYLLFATVLVLFGPPLCLGRLPWLTVFTLGILLSGSRAVFVLLLAVFLLFFLREKSPGPRKNILLFTLLAILGSVCYALLSGNRDGIGRFLTFSFRESEFLGRLLYARDVIPVILRNPLGLGYTGYRSLQGSFQTGVYSVRHVHNELLQLLADVGWIPAGLFLWALRRSFRSPAGGFLRKLLLSVLLLHCLLDFDTQFVSVALLLFLVLDAEPQVAAPLRTGPLTAASLAACCLFSVWLGSASLVYYLQKPAAALRIYPGYTSALIDLLPDTPEQEMDALADRILRLNRSVALAHDVKAETAFSAGSFSGMYAHKQEAIRLSRYNLREYLDYFDLLCDAYDLYLRSGDTASAERCLNLLREIPDMLASVDAKTSRLGRMIADRPELELPAGYRLWLAAHPS